jgi:hypothetical protein
VQALAPPGRSRSCMPPSSATGSGRCASSIDSTRRSS